MSDPFPLPGPNPYVVETISVGVTRNVRIGHEGEYGQPDEVWLSAEQFLALLDWGKDNREKIEYMAKERQTFEVRERNR